MVLITFLLCVCESVSFSKEQINVVLYSSLIFSICLVLQQLKSTLPRSLSLSLSPSLGLSPFLHIEHDCIAAIKSVLCYTHHR